MVFQLYSENVNYLRRDFRSNYSLRASQAALVMKNLSANAGDKRYRFNPWVGKIPLEKEMATHSSILAWKTLWMEKPVGLQSMESQRVGHD